VGSCNGAQIFTLLTSHDQRVRVHLASQAVECQPDRPGTVVLVALQLNRQSRLEQLACLGAVRHHVRVRRVLACGIDNPAQHVSQRLNRRRAEVSGRLRLVGRVDDDEAVAQLLGQSDLGLGTPAYADAQHQIGLVKRGIDELVAVAGTPESERERVHGRHRAVGVPDVDDRCLQVFGELYQCGAYLRPEGVLAGHDGDMLAGIDAGCNVLEVGHWLCFVLARRRSSRRLHRARGECADSDLDVNGTGTPAHCDGEGPVDGGRDLASFLDADRPLGHRLEGPLQEVGVIHPMKRLTRGVLRDTACDVDDRHAGRIGAGNSGEAVGRAGTGGEEHDARTAGDTCKELGGDGGVVLVHDGHDLDVGGVGQCIVEIDDVVPIKAEYRVDAVLAQSLDGYLRRGVGHDCRPFLFARHTSGLSGGP